MRVIAILTTLAVAAAPARADYADDAAVGLGIVKGAIDRTRRGIAIGPHVGGFGGGDLDGHGVHGVSFGLALYTFKTPSAFDFQAIVAARIRARVIERVKAIVASGGVAPTDLSQIAVDVAADVKAEILGEHVNRRRTFEKPAWKLVLEGTKLFAIGSGFQTRLVVGKGVRSLSYGLGLAVQRANSDTAVFLGPEIALHMTPIGQLRTPVFDLFVRGELGFGSVGSNHPFVVAVGLRALVDLL
jgi:hypothetical protein